MRLAKSWVTTIPRPPRSTRKWISMRCERSPCRGREVCDEHTSKSRSGVLGVATQFGIQTTGGGQRVDRFCHVPGTAQSFLYHSGPGTCLGSTTYESILTALQAVTRTDENGSGLDRFASLEVDPQRIRGRYSVGALRSPFVNLVRARLLEPGTVVAASGRVNTRRNVSLIVPGALRSVIRRKEDYVEFGADYYDQRNKPKVVCTPSKAASTIRLRGRPSGNPCRPNSSVRTGIHPDRACVPTTPAATQTGAPLQMQRARNSLQAPDLGR